MWTGRSPIARLLCGTLGMVVVFYAVPIHSQSSIGRAAFSIVLTLVGIGILAWAILEQLRRRMRTRSEDVYTLAMLLVVVVLAFALGFYALDEHLPRQVSGIATRTDALYFTLSTLTTVGFGDVHATGQVARGLVILQLVFNAVFVTALVSTVAGTVRSRAPHLGEGRQP